MTMSPKPRHYHGGVSGRRPGDQIAPGHHRGRDDCSICRARNAGPGTALDPAPERHGVYLTADRKYARYYASLAGRGDLYRVEPVGDVDPSSEDHFGTVVAPAALVVAVLERAVLLTDSQRRRLLARWTEAAPAAEGWGDRYRALSPADRRVLLGRQYQQMVRRAAEAVRHQ